MLDLVVRDVLTVEGPRPRPRTVAVRAGKVAALLEPGEAPAAARTLSLPGCILLPGLVDAHVHFREPGLTHKEDFESGSRAAALGGVTTVMVMPTDQPMTQTPEQFADKRRLAEGRCHVDFCLQALLGPDLAHVPALAALGAVSFEIFLGLLGEGQKITDDATLVAALRAVRAAGSVAGLTAFDGEEAPGVARAVRAQRIAGARMHLRQISAAPSLELLPQDDAQVTSEVTPHNLWLTDQASARLGTLAKVIPPLRAPDDVAAMRAALAAGRITMVATDHAPHAPHEKDAPFEQAPGGFPGVQTLLPLLLKLVAEGVLSYADLVRVACEAPARAFNLYPRKGALAVGADADFVAVDPSRPMQIRDADQASKARRTPFDGWSAPAAPVLTVLRGEVLCAEGKLAVSAPRGRFVAPLVYT